MDLEEIKQKMTENYPDVILGGYPSATYPEHGDHWLISCIGTNKINNEISTFYTILVSDFREFKDLEHLVSVLGCYINEYKYYFGETVIFQLDESEKIKGRYSILLRSDMVLRPFKPDKEINVWGFGVSLNHLIIPAKYQEVREFVGDYAAVKLFDKWGFVDRMGNETIPLIYDDVNDFCIDGFCWDYEDPIYYFKNEWSEIVFKQPQKFRQRFASVKLRNKWGFVNKQGEIAIPLEYDEVHPFRYGYALVKKDGKLGFIDHYGNTTTGYIFDDINGQDEWFPAVLLGDKWGYVSRNDKAYINLYYEYAYPFKADIAIVKANGKWGFIDKKIHPWGELEELSKHFAFDTQEAVMLHLDQKND